LSAPTPVSALVHSSTLVTAGVNLLIRFSPSFNTILLLVSGLTMFIAGLGANFKFDLKTYQSAGYEAQEVQPLGCNDHKHTPPFYRIMMTRCVMIRYMTKLTKQHKVIVVGDFEVLGFVNPGSGMKYIKDTSKVKLRQLSKEDVLVLWGGSDDIAKSNSRGGMRLH
jgi:hypothetical protein